MLKRTLERIIDYAIRVVEPETIILFGSMANNKANVFSDVDLLVITENTAMKKDMIARIVNYSSQLSLKTDVIICSRSDIELKSQKNNSFISAIIKSGKVVYENRLVAKTELRT